MTTFIPCPNGGRCGAQNHDPSSQAYKDCLSTSQKGVSSPTLSLVNNAAPPVAEQQEDVVRTLENALDSREVHYNSDHLIYGDDCLDTDQVQMYLDGDSELELYNIIYDNMHESIWTDVDDCLDGMLEKIGIDPDDLDEDERVDMIALVMSYDEDDFVQMLAENTPQRFLRANNTTLDDAYENASGEPGSDEWYDSISSAVWDRDIKGVMEWDSAEQEAEDKAAFQEAFKDLEPDYIHEDVAVSLLWGGSITDAAPSFEGDKELSIDHPHFVFVDGYNGTFNNTERMKGMARIIIPDGRKDADHKSRVIDDESEGMYGSVYQMGGLNIEAFRSRTLATQL